MYDIRIQDTCVQCGACVAVCPARVFVGNGMVAAARPAGCILCGHCVAVCPVDAVLHHGFDGEEFPPISDAARLDADALTSLLRARRSVREFKDQPVARPVLEKLLHIARYAPTASNAQDVRFIVITDANKRRALSQRIVKWMLLAGKLARIPGILPLAARSWGRERLQGYLGSLDGFADAAARGDDPIFYKSPALILTHRHKGNFFGVENSSYATYQLVLAAHAMGLGTCMIGFLTLLARYDPVLRRLAGIPKGHRIATALVVGYPIYRYRRLVPRREPKARWLE